MALQIPTLPSPIRNALQAYSPRLMPRFIPRYQAQAARILYHVDAMGSVAEADCKLTFITGLTSSEGSDWEYYAFMRGADIEGFMAITPTASGYRFYVARMHDAAGHVYLDATTKIADFPEATGTLTVFPGYVGFDA